MTTDLNLANLDASQTPTSSGKSVNFNDPADLSGLAERELGLLNDLHAGDPDCLALLQQFKTGITQAAMHTRSGRDTHARLIADDLMPTKGKERLLDELPGLTTAATRDHLGNAETALIILTHRLDNLALAHDPQRDVSTREEIGNFLYNAKDPGTAVGVLIHAAGKARYATLLAGDYGESLAARYGVDHGAIREAALRTVATSGTDGQRRATVARAGLHKAARILALAKSGRDNVLGTMAPGKPRHSY